MSEIVLLTKLQNSEQRLLAVPAPAEKQSDIFNRFPSRYPGKSNGCSTCPLNCDVKSTSTSFDRNIYTSTAFTIAVLLSPLRVKASIFRNAYVFSFSSTKWLGKRPRRPCCSRQRSYFQVHKRLMVLIFTFYDRVSEGSSILVHGSHLQRL